MTILLTVILVLLGALAMLLLALALFTRSTAKKVEQALPPRGRMVDVPGARLHVLEQGQGPALLLVHGLGGQMANLTYGMVERLAQRYRVVAVDRPGCGYSTRDPMAPADLGTQAEALAALIDKMQLGPTLLVGHSLGGALSLTLALRHPDKVAGLALIAPLTHLPDDYAVPAAFKALTITSPWRRKLVANTLATPASILRRHQVMEQVFGPDPVPRDFPTRGGGLLGLRPSHFLAASADMQAVPDSLPPVCARYSELRMPVAVLFSKDDRILDWKINGQGLVDKVPGAELKLVPGGHMLPVTCPDVCAEFIETVAQRAWNAPGSAARQ